MESQLIFLIIFLIIFCFIIFQCYEFVLNYDYIVDFNRRYKNYEYASSPSFNYTDASVFDPNDVPTRAGEKWKCVKSNGQWFAISEKGYVTVNRQIATWTNELQCINYIFDQSVIGFVNPCSNNINANTSECTLLRNNRNA